MQMRCDVNKPAARYKYVDNKPVAIETPGERAQDIAVGGKPLDAKHKYTIATLDYLARGGNSYLPLQFGERKCVDGKAFEPDNKTSCGDTALLADVISEAVAAGELDQP
jgi:2',3'-cyclic-nucleotide 2'-phosphodiesterase (5'-nucleotidase family)